MSVLDDIASDAHSQTGTFSDRFGGKEVLKQMLFHLVGHAFAIVGHGDNDVAVARGNSD